MKKHIIIISLLLALPSSVFAAAISFRATPERVGVGDIVRVDVLLDSAVPTNAFSGVLSYPAMLEPVAISDGNSVINLWITHPAVPTTGTSIPFAGITPGGFSGTGGVLFSVLFRAKAAGTANMALTDMEVLRNDGEGGKEPVTLKPLTVSIGLKPLGEYTEPPDTTPPESFAVFLGNDSELFGGRSYIVFTAVDKGSGIDYYEVAESRMPSFLLRFFPSSWRAATSPYALADQHLTSTVYVKARDRAGNERVSVFPPHRLFTPYENAILLVILIGVVLLWHIRRKRGQGRR